MASKKYCHYCGAYYYKDLAECPECGSDNLPAQFKQDQDRREKTEKRKKRKRNKT